VFFGDNIHAKMRLIDCVGYLVDGAIGGNEDGKDRMVRTPWSDDEMPFKKAAEIGTDKVIRDHSTIALAITTDGSFSDIKREDYEPAEEKVVAELKATGKPFVIVLNVKDENNPSAHRLKDALEDKYSVPVVIKNALQMDEGDISEIMESILLEFGVKTVDFNLPKWVQALPTHNYVVKELIDRAKSYGDELAKMRDYERMDAHFEDAEFWQTPNSIDIDAGTGKISVNISPKDGVFIGVLNGECGMEMNDECDLYMAVRDMARGREKTAKILDALEQVQSVGYGIVAPTIEDMVLGEPEIIRQGQQYGVKLRASAPSLHIMQVDVETEVSPIVGTEQQSEELVKGMLGDFDGNKQAIWDTNIFGRSLSSLVADGIRSKLTSVPAEAEIKLKKTLGRIVNEGKGGVICILL
jgi:stage IV sporulation protein A